MQGKIPTPQKESREDVSKRRKKLTPISNFNSLYLHILRSYIKHVPKCTFSERPNIKNQRAHTSIDFFPYIQHTQNQPNKTNRHQNQYSKIS